MNDLCIEAVGALCIVGGFVGCVVPVIPGPLLSYCGLLALLLSSRAPGIPTLIAGGVVVTVAAALDMLVPTLGAKRFQCSRLGVVGCAVGSLVGSFFLPLGLVLGPFLGAVAGELIAGRELGVSLHGGLGALLGFLLSFLIKLMACGILAALFAFCVWRDGGFGG